METLYRVPFLVLECPNLKLKKPPWVHMPSAMTVYALVVVSYFLITGGIIYDVIVEPPSVGSMTDEHGHQRPVAFLAYRVNGQYIMEGLASSFLFTMGGLGFIILDRSNAPNIPKLNRFLLLFIGFVCVLLSFFMARVFMRMKLPSLVLMAESLAKALTGKEFLPVHSSRVLYGGRSLKQWITSQGQNRVSLSLEPLSRMNLRTCQRALVLATGSPQDIVCSEQRMLRLSPIEPADGALDIRIGFESSGGS
ncbi:hypothetical protein U0070_002987 [Myodes glareolus]